MFKKFIQWFKDIKEVAQSKAEAIHTIKALGQYPFYSAIQLDEECYFVCDDTYLAANGYVHRLPSLMVIQGIEFPIVICNKLFKEVFNECEQEALIKHELAHVKLGHLETVNNSKLKTFAYRFGRIFKEPLIEYDADKYAIEVLGADRECFISVLGKLKAYGFKMGNRIEALK